MINVGLKASFEHLNCCVVRIPNKPLPHPFLCQAIDFNSSEKITEIKNPAKKCIYISCCNYRYEERKHSIKVDILPLSLSAIAEGLQVQVRNLHVSLLIIRKTGVKIIQGHHPLCSQEWHNYWIKLQTHFKKAATKTWQNAAIAMMMDGYCNFRELKSVSAIGTQQEKSTKRLKMGTTCDFLALLLLRQNGKNICKISKNLRHYKQAK